MNKELEEAKTDCEEFIKELTELKDTYIGTIYYKNKPIEDILKTILKALDNSISKEVIEKKLNNIEDMIDKISKGKLQKYTVGELIAYRKIYNELLEGK